MRQRRPRMGAVGTSPSAAARTARATRFLRCDDGAAAAELAVALPAAIAVLGLCLGALTLGATQLALADAAADAARALARGDDAGLAHARVAQVDPAATFSVSEGELICVTAVAPARIAGRELGVSLEASACALGEGR